MADINIKKRLRKEKKKAVAELQKTGYKAFPSDNDLFCVLGIRKKEIRMIRVVIDKITDEDIRLVKEFEPPGICTKEIWCKRENDPDFEIKEIL